MPAGKQRRHHAFPDHLSGSPWIAPDDHFRRLAQQGGKGGRKIEDMRGGETYANHSTQSDL
jgi:hypothetical protein